MGGRCRGHGDRRRGRSKWCLLCAGWSQCQVTPLWYILNDKKCIDSIGATSEVPTGATLSHSEKKRRRNNNNTVYVQGLFLSATHATPYSGSTCVKRKTVFYLGILGRSILDWLGGLSATGTSWTTVEDATGTERDLKPIAKP